MNRLLSCCAVVALASGSAFGATLNVPGDAADIDGAFALAVAGDEILVAPGTYPGFTVTVEDVDVIGTGGSAVTIIDGADDQAIKVEAIDGSISGFTVINGKAGFGNNNEFEGGCVDIAADITGVSLDDMQFVDCQAEFLGGAVYVGENAGASITNSLFSGCSADLGGAIGLDPGATLSASDCDFVDNRATRSGGAIDAFLAQVELEACCFTRNEATRSRTGLGGAIMNSFSAFFAYNCVFDSNWASRGGGAWFTEDGTNGICFSTFYNNSATSGAGFEQDASPSGESDPDAGSRIANSIFVLTSIFNNNAEPIAIQYSFSDEDLAAIVGVIPGAGNLGVADLPDPLEPVAPQLFTDAENGDFTLVRCDPCLPPSVDPDAPPCYTAIVIDAGTCEVCDQIFFDKADNCRGIDVVDNTATGDCDEGIDNTGVACLLRNCTFDAPDMGAFEYVQAPVAPIPTSCPGDTNLDGMRNIMDLLPTLENFGVDCP